MTPYPEWLHFVAWCYLLACSGCAAIIIVNLIFHRQKMWIMNAVWPITALYFGPFALWLYYRMRPISTSQTPQLDPVQKKRMKQDRPSWQQVSTAVFHCGAGCTLGDIAGEVGLFAIGGAALTFIGGSEFTTKLVVDFVLAYALGIFFQYFTIVPMRGLSPGQGILAAMRADTISITAFEIGMFVWMALTRFWFFPEPRLIHPNMAVFWFMMQIAMMVGFLTSYPANVWLLKKGWKEKMP